jgi:hypothetical protein
MMGLRMRGDSVVGLGGGSSVEWKEGKFDAGRECNGGG